MSWGVGRAASIACPFRSRLNTDDKLLGSQDVFSFLVAYAAAFSIAARTATWSPPTA